MHAPIESVNTGDNYAPMVYGGPMATTQTTTAATTFTPNGSTDAPTVDGDVWAAWSCWSCGAHGLDPHGPACRDRFDDFDD